MALWWKIILMAGLMGTALCDEGMKKDCFTNQSVSIQSSEAVFETVKETEMIITMKGNSTHTLHIKPTTEGITITSEGNNFRFPTGGMKFEIQSKEVRVMNSTEWETVYRTENEIFTYMFHKSGNEEVCVKYGTKDILDKKQSTLATEPATTSSSTDIETTPHKQETEGETDRVTEAETDRVTEAETDRVTDRGTDRETTSTSHQEPKIMSTQSGQETSTSEAPTQSEGSGPWWCLIFIPLLVVVVAVIYSKRRGKIAEYRVKSAQKKAEDDATKKREGNGEEKGGQQDVSVEMH